MAIATTPIRRFVLGINLRVGPVDLDKLDGSIENGASLGDTRIAEVSTAGVSGRRVIVSLSINEPLS
jgi:hypothetical protein